MEHVLIDLLSKVDIGTLPTWGTTVILAVLAWKLSSKNGSNPVVSSMDRMHKSLKQIEEHSGVMAAGTEYLVQREKKRERIEEAVAAQELTK